MNTMKLFKQKIKKNCLYQEAQSYLDKIILSSQLWAKLFFCEISFFALSSFLPLPLSLNHRKNQYFLEEQRWEPLENSTPCLLQKH